MPSRERDDRSWIRRFTRATFGPGREADLTIVHCFHAVGEAFFVVSLAGSIFFSVSPDAARPRVLLFLTVTLAPFLVMAPLVGPFVDRLRGGLVAAATSSLAVRAVLALILAQNLRSVLLFPLAFAMLVSAKTYTVARNGLVPVVVADPDHLVACNARLSRTATVVAGVFSIVAVGVYAWASPAWTLRIAAVVYLIGAVVAPRLRAASRERAERLAPAEPDVLIKLARPEVSEAIWVMMVLRGAVGFALFQFGFSLRADGAPVWVLGAVIVGNSLGAFVGSVIAPVLRRWMMEPSMLALALAAPAIVAGLASLAFNEYTLVLTITVLGCGASVARRALDATIQREAPEARLGRVYAGLETRLELCWVGAACLAVGVRVASWIGVLALAVFLVVVALFHLRRRVGLRVLHPVVVSPLPERLLLRAETLAEHGYYDEAVMLASLARDAASDGKVNGSSRESAFEAIDLARHVLHGADPADHRDLTET